MQSPANEIRQFVIDNFLFGEWDESLTDDDSFLEKGLIDSTGVLELVTFLETHFEIQIADNELVPENLDSINRVTAFVESKRESLVEV